MNWFRKKIKYTDEEVIQIIQEGSQFENAKLNPYLLDISFKPLLHSKEAIHLLENPELRLDAYHAAFVQFILEIRKNTFRKESAMFTFFTRIFYNRCKDISRQLNTNKYKVTKPDAVSMEEMMKKLSDRSQNILTKIGNKMDTDYLYKILRKISELCFQVICLKAQGYSYDEIGFILDTTSSSAKSTHYNCLQKIKARVAK